MKRKSRSPRKADRLMESQKPPEPMEIPADEHLSGMESIASIENEIVDDANMENLEAAERDYSGRSTQEEDGAVPVIPPEQNPVSARSLRRPEGPPKHNI